MVLPRQLGALHRPISARGLPWGVGETPLLPHPRVTGHTCGHRKGLGCPVAAKGHPAPDLWGLCLASLPPLSGTRVPAASPGGQQAWEASSTSRAPL